MVNAPLRGQVKCNFGWNQKKKHPLHFIACILICRKEKTCSHVQPAIQGSVLWQSGRAPSASRSALSFFTCKKWQVSNKSHFSYEFRQNKNGKELCSIVLIRDGNEYPLPETQRVLPQRVLLYQGLEPWIQVNLLTHWFINGNKVVLVGFAGTGTFLCYQEPTNLWVKYT